MIPAPLRRPLAFATFLFAITSAAAGFAVELLRLHEMAPVIYHQYGNWIDRVLDPGVSVKLSGGAVYSIAPVRSTPEEIGLSSIRQEYMAELADGVKAFGRGSVENAYLLLQEAGKRHNDLPPAQVLMAQLYYKAAQKWPAIKAAHDAAGPDREVPFSATGPMERIDGSKFREKMYEWLERAVKEVPRDPEAYVILGELDLHERRWTQAELLFRKAERLLANFRDKEVWRRKEAMQPRVLLGLASVAEARDDWPGAEKHLEAALKLDPKNTDILQRLGRALFLQKDIEKLKAGYERFKEARRIDQEVLLPEVQLALLYQAAGERHKAWLWMDSAAKIAGKSDVPTLLVVAPWAAENGRIEKAKEWSDIALTADPKSFEAIMVRGIVMLFAENEQAAANHFEKAHLMKPASFAASNNLAIALAEQMDDKKKRQALEFAENNRKLHPKSAEAASTYGWALYQNGRLDEAERVLKEALAAPPHNPDMLYYARAVIDNGRVEFGTRLLTAALESKAPFVNRNKAAAELERLQEKEAGRRMR